MNGGCHGFTAALVLCTLLLLYRFTFFCFIHFSNRHINFVIKFF